MVAVALSSPKLMDALDHLARRPISILEELRGLREFHEAIGLRSFVDEFRTRALRRIEMAEEEQQQWIADGRNLRTDLWQRAMEEVHEDERLNALTKIIEVLDAKHKEASREIERLQRGFRKGQKEAHAISPRAGAALAEVDNRLFSYLKRDLEERMDIALFLRAVRAQMDPESRGGPTFDDPKELKRYIDRSLR